MIPKTLEAAERAVKECDAVIALGSTLSVYPAAGFPLMAARRGVPYAIINRGPTEHDGLPEVTVRCEGDVGVIFPKAVERLLEDRRELDMPRRAFLVAWAVLVSQAVLLAHGWDRLDGCEFFEGSHSDGDSIEVRRSGKHYVFRLYFVDCVEKNPASRARRAAQARYFGLKASETTALRAAYLARNFTTNKLRKPFTIYTRWQAVDPDGEQSCHARLYRDR